MWSDSHPPIVINGIVAIHNGRLFHSPEAVKGVPNFHQLKNKLKNHPNTGIAPKPIVNHLIIFECITGLEFPQI